MGQTIKIQSKKLIISVILVSYYSTWEGLNILQATFGSTVIRPKPYNSKADLITLCYYSLFHHSSPPKVITGLSPVFWQCAQGPNHAYMALVLSSQKMAASLKLAKISMNPNVPLCLNLCAGLQRASVKHGNTHKHTHTRKQKQKTKPKQNQKNPWKCRGRATWIDTFIKENHDLLKSFHEMDVVITIFLNLLEEYEL